MKWYGLVLNIQLLVLNIQCTFTNLAVLSSALRNKLLELRSFTQQLCCSKSSKIGECALFNLTKYIYTRLCSKVHIGVEKAILSTVKTAFWERNPLKATFAYFCTWCIMRVIDKALSFFEASLVEISTKEQSLSLLKKEDCIKSYWNSCALILIKISDCFRDSLRSWVGTFRRHCILT